MEEYYGIAIFQEAIKAKLSRIKNKYIKETIATSLAVQIVIAPIMIYTSKTLSLTFIISNLLTSYLITLIIMLGFILIILSLIFKPLANLVAPIYKTILILLEKIVNLTSNIPFAKIYIKAPYLYQIAIYYLIMLLVLYLFKTKRNKKLKKHKTKIIAIILIIMLIPNLIEIIPPGKLILHMIDVGQGDACLVITPQNQTILIDGGGSETYNVGKNTLLPYLLNRRITTLDYVIISHFDTDHCARNSIYHGRTKSKKCNNSEYNLKVQKITNNLKR